jgi:hypothetical protein
VYREDKGKVERRIDIVSNKDQSFDNLAKGLAEERVSRGKALKLVGAAILGGLLASIPGVALAAPQTCVTCVCGTGRPCNPKSSTCAELREFPVGTTCERACARQNLNFCGGATKFHCPHGCPS